MVLKRTNKLILKFALSAVVASFAFPVFAAEPLWRVKNDDEGEIVPPYAGNLSPFPIKQVPINEKKRIAKKKVKPKPMLSPEQRSAQRRAQRSAELLASIRKAIQNKEAFSPDVSLVIVEAMLKGPSGYKILVNNQWYSVGEVIDVPVITAEAIENLVSDLSVIDNNLSQMIEEDFLDKIGDSEPFRLKIKSVDKDQVLLVSADKEQFTIPFVSSGW